MNLEKGIAYQVVKGNTDNSIEKDDIIWLSSNNDLCSKNGHGWLSEEEWTLLDMNDFEVKKSNIYYVDNWGGREGLRFIKKKKIAVIEGKFARDTQIFAGDPEKEACWESDNWLDANCSNLYLGAFENEEDDAIKERVAKEVGINPIIITIYEI